MLSKTAKNLPAPNVGDNVGLPIPKVDRRKLGPNHILCVITIISSSFHSIRTNKGTLDSKFTRGEFEL